MALSTGLLLDHYSLTIATINTDQHKTSLTYAKHVKLPHPFSHQATSNLLASIIPPDQNQNKTIRIGLSTTLFKLTSHTVNISLTGKRLKHSSNKYPTYSDYYLYTTKTKHDNQQKIISLTINKNIVNQIAAFLKNAKQQDARCELEIFTINRLLNHPTTSTLIITEQQSSYLVTLIKDKMVVEAKQCKQDANSLLQTLLYYKKNYPHLTHIQTYNDKPLTCLQALAHQFDLFVKPIAVDWLDKQPHPHILIAAGIANGEHH